MIVTIPYINAHFYEFEIRFRFPFELFLFFFFLQIESNVSKIFKNWKIKTIIFFHAN